MNLLHLGDALDYWKGSLFENLISTNALSNLAVDAMATDVASWTPDDYALYARLLRVACDKLIHHERPLDDTVAYFEEIQCTGDLFLDPDIGILPKSACRSRQHISPMIITGFLHTPRSRVVAVYQHIRAQKTDIRVDSCVARVLDVSGPTGWCSYESSTVAMLFFSVDTDRIIKLHSALHALLGSRADQRIRLCTPTSIEPDCRAIG
jgi:hypothetical protein